MKLRKTAPDRSITLWTCAACRFWPEMIASVIIGQPLEAVCPNAASPGLLRQGAEEYDNAQALSARGSVTGRFCIDVFPQ